MNNFNHNHPELKDGEMFFSNFTQDGFDKLGFKTKRLGVVAYQSNGIRLNFLRVKRYPVFILRKEWSDGLRAIDKIVSFFSKAELN